LLLNFSIAFYVNQRNPSGLGKNDVKTKKSLLRLLIDRIGKLKKLIFFLSKLDVDHLLKAGMQKSFSSV